MYCYKCYKEIMPGDDAMHGLHKDCFCQWFAVGRDDDFTGLAAKSSVSQELDTTGSMVNSSFFHGKYKKYSAVLNNANYIIKVEEESYKDLPAMEYLCNQIAVLLGLRVPEFYFLRFENSVNAFVSRNFMDHYKVANLEHIYHFLGSEKEFSCPELVDVIRNKTSRISEVERFVRLCLFDALIGNHDRHGRNIALINTGRGYELAPFYDNPSYLGIEDARLLKAMHDPRGKIVCSFEKNPVMKDYVKEFLFLKKHNAVEKFILKIDMARIGDTVNRSFIARGRKDAFLRLINRRYRELKDEYAQRI